MLEAIHFANMPMGAHGELDHDVELDVEVSQSLGCDFEQIALPGECERGSTSGLCCPVASVEQQGGLGAGQFACVTAFAENCGHSLVKNRFDQRLRYPRHQTRGK